MSDKQMEQFQQHEAGTIALSVTFNRWSLVMIEVMVKEQEQKLVASDLPVDSDDKDDFWMEMP